MVAEECAVCTKPASQRCGGCHVTYYCSREHQKLDWKGHRGSCRPFKVAENSELGRHLVATRDIKIGEVILTEPPLIAGPSQVTAPVCLGCYQLLSEGKSRPCPGCGWPMCSDRCAKTSAHLPECDITRHKRGSKVSIKNFVYPHPTYQSVMVVRCLYQREANPALWTKLLSLESHCEHRKKTPKYEEDRVSVAQFVRRFFKLEFSEEEILRMCGTVEVNGHEVPVTEPPHVAVYDTASLLEHNCRPNCSKSFTSSGDLIVRTAEPIARGQHLSICYSDAMWGTANRRHHLAETKYFWCRCERCADPTEFGTYFSAVRCQQGACDGYSLPDYPLLDGTAEENNVAKSDWRCRSCGTTTPALDVFSVLERVGRSLSTMEKGKVASCERFLAEFGRNKLLHPNHYNLIDVELALAQLYGQECPAGLPGLSDEDLDKKIKLCQKVLSLSTALVPAENRVRGVLMFELHASVAEEARRKANKGEMDHVELRDRLLESKRLLTGAAFWLQHEPDVLPEGKMAIQAKRNLADLNVLLQNLHATIGDSPL